MYLDSARQRIEERSFPDAEDIHPCTPDEVEALERKLSQPLPAALREFLLWCGHGLGDIWSGNRCSEYEELMEGAGLEEARKVLLQDGQDASLLADPVLVLQYDECDQFSFVRLDEGEDPPVYGRNEGEPVQRHCDHFSDYVKLIVDQEFGLEEGEDEGEGDAAPSPTPAGRTAEPVLPSIVPPDCKPDRTWVEESFGFLPPSVQRQLGDLRASFCPSSANLFAGIVIGTLILLSSLALMGLGIREVALEHFQVPLLAKEGMSWLMFGLIEVAGAGMSVGGVLMIRHALRLSRGRVYVGEAGLCCTRDARQEVMLWTELRRVEETVIRERWPLLDLLRGWIPLGATRFLLVHATDGRTLRFDANNIRSLARFEALLRHAVSLHRVPWSVVQVQT